MTMWLYMTYNAQFKVFHHNISIFVLYVGCILVLVNGYSFPALYSAYPPLWRFDQNKETSRLYVAEKAIED